MSRVLFCARLPNAQGPCEFEQRRVPVERLQYRFILNLLLNGSQAMSGIDDRPRLLVVRTQRDEGDCVRLTVQDAGVRSSRSAGSRAPPSARRDRSLQCRRRNQSAVCRIVRSRAGRPRSRGSRARAPASRGATGTKSAASHAPTVAAGLCLRSPHVVEGLRYPARGARLTAR
jgi:hypothetical protein